MHGWSTCTSGRLQTQLARYMSHANQAKSAKDRRRTAQWISSVNREPEPREPRDPSCEPSDRPMGSLDGGGCSSGSGSAKGLVSVTGVLAGPVRMMGTPLTGRIGDPTANLPVPL